MNGDEYIEEEHQEARHPAVIGLQKLLEAMKLEPCFDADDCSKVEDAIATEGKKLEEQLQLMQDAERRKLILGEYIDKYDLGLYFGHLVNDLADKTVSMESLASGLTAMSAPHVTPRGGRSKSSL